VAICELTPRNAAHVHQRIAAVAAIDGRVGLQKTLVLVKACESRSSLR
jgi:hypothetical protein